MNVPWCTLLVAQARINAPQCTLLIAQTRTNTPQYTLLIAQTRTNTPRCTLLIAQARTNTPQCYFKVRRAGRTPYLYSSREFTEYLRWISIMVGIRPNINSVKYSKLSPLILKRSFRL